jgi:excisionase family DNA binding protein
MKQQIAEPSPSAHGSGRLIGGDSRFLLDELAADPMIAERLTSLERRRAQLQCLLILTALATAPEKREEKLLEPAEAAHRMRVGRSKVYEMLRGGHLPFVSKGRRGKLIPESEIEGWIAQNLRLGAGLQHQSLDERVSRIDSRREIGIDKKGPPTIREDGVASRPSRRLG